MRKFYIICGCLVGIGAFMVYVIINSIFTVRPRAGVSMTHYQFRELAIRLNSFYKRYGYYPPHSVEGSYYTIASDELTSPVPILEDFPPLSPTENQYPIYKGPPVDPYRTKPTFQGEQKGRAWFCDGRNSEFLCWYKGYRPRYYRGIRHDFATLLGNGPDKDADLSPAVLDSITTSSEAAIISSLQPYFYDPTNGTLSSGDIVGIVTPDYP